MKIAISERLRPYSRTPGIQVPIPGTGEILTAYPTQLKVGTREIPLGVEGPVHNFCVELDLERGKIAVSGRGAEGFFRVLVSADKIVWERGARKGESLKLSDREMPSSPVERLSLGVSKQLEWEQVWRRMDLRELAPLVFALAQWMPQGAAKEERPFTESFVRAAFRGMFAPTLVDDLHQGLPSLEKAATAPVGLIEGAGNAIARSIVEWDGEVLKLLPSLPRDWIVGRMTGIVLEGLGTLDLEWTRSVPRRAILRATAERAVSIALPKPLHSFRLRKSESDRGRRVETLLEVQAGQTILLDRFQK